MLARQIAIGFGIALIFPLLVYYGVATVFPPPQPVSVDPLPLMPPNPTPEERQVFQEKLQEHQKTQQERQQAYNTDAKEFAHRLLIISAPLGVAAILIGAYLSLAAIGTGLIIGGIDAIVWGYWNYWSYLENWLRFLSLLVGFAFLLFVGYRRAAGSTRASVP